MHAYLFVGNETAFLEKVQSLLLEKNAVMYPYTITSINDVRALSKFVRLTQSQNFVITVTNLHNASVEALNAFLKDLEEPQSYITYALHTNSEDAILPTIRSRCEVVRLPTNVSFINIPIIDEYLSKDLEGKLEITDKLKGRDEAITFVDNLISTMHQKLLKNPNKEVGNVIQIATKTRKSLSQNGNVFLHMSVMGITLESHF